MLILAKEGTSLCGQAGRQVLQLGGQVGGKALSHSERRSQGGQAGHCGSKANPPDLKGSRIKTLSTRSRISPCKLERR